ncbi:hypothetical protein AGLY_004626 [Aphis glycines]|uniref:Uncharacterized protein n=1 Tax=Aphis glycines TaxID=307491 RepID=A0A6G0TUU5_APHGL|nr:hypothetical protein AGLY_004626 [Aphis glycines]
MLVYSLQLTQVKLKSCLYTSFNQNESNSKEFLLEKNKRDKITVKRPSLNIVYRSVMYKYILLGYSFRVNGPDASYVRIHNKVSTYYISKSMKNNPENKRYMMYISFIHHSHERKCENATFVFSVWRHKGKRFPHIRIEWFGSHSNVSCFKTTGHLPVSVVTPIDTNVFISNENTVITGTLNLYWNKSGFFYKPVIHFKINNYFERDIQIGLFLKMCIYIPSACKKKIKTIYSNIIRPRSSVFSKLMNTLYKTEPINYHVNRYSFVAFHVTDAGHAIAVLVLKHHAPRRRLIIGNDDLICVLKKKNGLNDTENV